MAKAADGRPRHQQIAAEIRAQIISGDLPAGSQLPFTRELMAQYEAANQTIQEALKLLKEEGFAEGRKGTGVFVRDRQPFVVEAGPYFAPTPGGWSYDLLEVAEVGPPTDVARALSLPPGGVAVLRHRLMRYNGDPVELDWSYYPVEIAQGTKLTGGKKIRGGAPAVLAEQGFPQRDWVDEISVRPPTSEEIRQLELPAEVQVIRQFRTIFSDDGRVVEVSVLIKGGHLYSLKYHQPVH
jgi:GntR family transcriptional regulator